MFDDGFLGISFDHHHHHGGDGRGLGSCIATSLPAKYCSESDVLWRDTFDVGGLCGVWPTIITVSRLQSG